MKETLFKTIIAAALTGLSAYLGLLFVPLMVLTLVMLGDYITGLVSAWINSQISSRTGVVGIVKKACYLLVVAVGMTADWVVKSALVQAGVSSPKTVFMFGLLVTVWLVINELISILENLSKIGVPMPSFLKSAIKRLKIAVESSAEVTGEPTNAI